MPAAQRLSTDLQTVNFKTAAIPVIQNINGRVARSPEEIRDNLVKQLYLPVQWTESINCMRDFSIGRIVECGPGKVLGGLIKRIQPDITCFSSDDRQSLEAALSA